MRKLGILVINGMIIFLLTGCWSRVEINDIAIVTATAIDRMSDGEIRLSLQVAIPKQLGPVGAGGTGSEKGNDYSYFRGGAKRDGRLPETSRKITASHILFS